MPNEKQPESAESKAGSSDELIKEQKTDPNLSGGAGQSDDKQTPLDGDASKKDDGSSGSQPSEETIPKKQYTELEKKLGIQGEEVGEYRKYLDEVRPLLEKLSDQPELVQAILDGKVNTDLVKSVSEGKVPISEAETVSKAHTDVKKELGKKEYTKSTPEEIEKLVSERISTEVEKVKKDMKKDLNEVEVMREFENKVNDFIARTPDFPEYATAIQEWFDNHPEQTDVEIAYNVVRGQTLEKKVKEDAEKAKVDAAKEVVANAGGGQSRSSSIIKDKNLADELVSSRRNPNTFGV